MYCERCNSDMWDNRTTKKNPKQPDYKCKNPECGHAVWLPKENPVDKALKEGQPKQQVSNGGQKVDHNSMIMAYAKDVVVAEIMSGKDVTEPFKRIADGFKALLVAYKDPFKQ